MGKVTFAPVIYAQFKRHDGNYAVKMRVTLNRKSKFITTSEVASPGQITRSLRIKDSALMQRLRDLEGRMRKAISALDMYTLDGMTVDEVISYMEKRINGDFRLDFFQFWPEAVADKPKGSRDNYMIAMRNFQRFLGVESFDISNVSAKLMRSYEAWLEKNYGKGARAVTMYTGAVKHVHSLARKRFNDDEAGDVLIRNPFAFYVPPKSKATRHRNVEAAVIQEMIDCRKSLSGTERRAVDAFLLSFGLMGMNCPDLLSCRPPKDGVIIYNRQKTRDRRDDRAEMRVRIEDCIRPLYDEWKDCDGEHCFIFHRLHANFRQMNWMLCKALAQYRKRKGIPEGGLSFYSARHTWASLAYSIGIDKSVINDCLCHTEEAMKVTDIYINKDWSVLWNANLRVLSLFQWQ